mmetsp:Transcript_19727/g.57413  ORF Transcript_19727/g.57413 Transcript_19727/m.57413 type:complete len:270 (-) Transcript_19727:354-1163(-)
MAERRQACCHRRGSARSATSCRSIRCPSRRGRSPAIRAPPPPSARRCPGGRWRWGRSPARPPGLVGVQDADPRAHRPRGRTPLATHPLPASLAPTAACRRRTPARRASPSRTAGYAMRPLRSKISLGWRRTAALQGPLREATSATKRWWLPRRPRPATPTTSTEETSTRPIRRGPRGPLSFHCFRRPGHRSTPCPRRCGPRLRRPAPARPGGSPKRPADPRTKTLSGTSRRATRMRRQTKQGGSTPGSPSPRSRRNRVTAARRRGRRWL